MFVVELADGIRSGSVSLLADAMDLFGDAANYGMSLFVLPLAPIWRPRTALVKGVTMGEYGILILATTCWNYVNGAVPSPAAMGFIGAWALASNLGVALRLYAYRNCDSDMRSVWLCSSNDAIANIAVMLAAIGVFGTGRGWPDVVVACILDEHLVTSFSMVVTIGRWKKNVRRNAQSPDQFTGRGFVLTAYYLLRIN